MKKTFLLLMSIVCLVLTSCEKEKTPAQLLQKTWIASSQEILGSVVPLTDGSSLTFNADNKGVDYKGSNKSTGSFTYTLNDAGTSVAIVDTDGNGGNYNYTWTVETLTESDLTISTNTGMFGVIRIILKAQ
jgi:hypothetical protein